MPTSLVEKLKKSVKEGSMSYGVLCDAVEHLRDTQEIVDYYNTFKNLVKADLRKNLRNHLSLSQNGTPDAVIAIRNGKTTVEQAAEKLAVSRFAYVLNKYYDTTESKEIHKAWKRALPNVYCRGGRLPNILGF
jgi:hypothetical protein